jgi:DNA-directed DNA polymerase III PolC
MFTHLHVHSNFTFLSGAATVEDLAERAREVGMSALALTDRNGLYGAIPFYKAARERGLQPILGVELDDPQDPRMRAVLLAENRRGFSHLCRLITRRKLQEEFRLAEALKEPLEGIIILTADPTLLDRLPASGDGDRLYGELTPAADQGGRRRIARTVEAARRRGIPLVATGDVYLVRAADHALHRLLRAIGANRTLHSLDGEEQATSWNYLAAPEAMQRLWREFPQALKNTEAIRERCRLDLDLGTYRFPSFPLPPEETPFSYLWKISFRGLKRRYRPLTERAIERLKYELDTIEQLGFSSYFLVVWDIARRARALRIPAIGRGSAANSIVSYCLEITHVDPLAHNLYFERFLNPQRTSPPDIDLDFCWKRRDQILEYVYQTYGQDHVAMIATTVTLGARSAVREVAKVMGLEAEEIRRLASPIPFWGVRDLRTVREDFPECRHLPLDREPYRTVINAAQRIRGYPRHLSVHPGGMVISPTPLTDHLPLEKAPKGLIITQYDMFSVEDLGLVKIDLLGQRSLGVLQDAVEAVERHYGRTPPVEDTAAVFGDRAARSLIREGRTMGCFYIESPAMRSLLKKLRTDTFPGLTAASSVIRPGVAESGMMDQYIRRHREPAQVRYLHPKLEELLGETYGVMVYQEDVIKVAHHLAGMSLGEADLLRRAMSGKLRSRAAMARLQKDFVSSCRRRGVHQRVAREIWRQIASFAGYAFCKAHSASYAILSFQVAYLKAHHPAEFMAAVLSNGGGFYGPGAYIQEARRLGLKILLPDINKSDYEYIGRQGTIRIGLMAVKGLSVDSVSSLLEARRGGYITSLSDLRRRTSVGFKELHTLIRCGALDCFELSRPELLWRLEAAGKGRGPDGPQGEAVAGRPIAEELNGSLATIVPRIPEYSQEQRCLIELETFGYMVSRHPLELLVPHSKWQGIVTADRMDEHAGREVRMIGWLIAANRITARKSGQPMKFMSLEDLTGTFEVTLFPDVYRRHAHLTLGHGPYLVTGKVENSFGACSLTARTIEPIGRPSLPAADFAVDNPSRMC